MWDLETPPEVEYTKFSILNLRLLIIIVLILFEYKRVGWRFQIIIMTTLLMPVKQNSFTHLRVLLVLTARGILAQSNWRC
jgi:hypothetical protein